MTMPYMLQIGTCCKSLAGPVCLCRLNAGGALCLPQLCPSTQPLTAGQSQGPRPTYPGKGHVRVTISSGFSPLLHSPPLHDSQLLLLLLLLLSCSSRFLINDASIPNRTTRQLAPCQFTLYCLSVLLTFVNSVIHAQNDAVGCDKFVQDVALLQHHALAPPSEALMDRQAHHMYGH